MATVPLVVAGAELAIETFSAVAPFARSLIQHVEAFFKSPKSGPQKLATVVQGTATIVDALAKAGEVKSTIPMDALTGMVQGLFDSLKAAGLLSPAQPAVPAAAAVTGGTAQQWALLLTTAAQIIQAGAK